VSYCLRSDGYSNVDDDIDYVNYIRYARFKIYGMIWFVYNDDDAVAIAIV
jgi:hypothetical protein